MDFSKKCESWRYHGRFRITGYNCRVFLFYSESIMGIGYRLKSIDSLCLIPISNSSQVPLRGHPHSDTLRKLYWIWCFGWSAMESSRGIAQAMCTMEASRGIPLVKKNKKYCVTAHRSFHCAKNKSSLYNWRALIS